MSPMPSISAGHDQIIQLERSARQWPLMPERFSFFILDDDGPKLYKLRRKVISFGADYVLYDEHNKKIGLLDGKVITLGGAWQGPGRWGPLLQTTRHRPAAVLRHAEIQ